MPLRPWPASPTALCAIWHRVELYEGAVHVEKWDINSAQGT